MAHTEDRGGSKGRRLQQAHAKDKVPPSSIMHLSSRYDRKQRMLNRFKLPTPKFKQNNEPTKQNTSKMTEHLPKMVEHVQTKKKLGSSLEKNNYPNLTITTTASTCVSTLGQSTLSQSTLGQSRTYDSWDSFASFEGSPKTPSDGDLFSEWLQLHACSGETAPSHTFDDDVYEQVELRRTRASNELKSKPSRDQDAGNNEKIKSTSSKDCQTFDSEVIKSTTSLRDHRSSNEKKIKSTSSRDRHSDNEAINSKKSARDRHSDKEVINTETPRDLLSGNYYSFASSADTMSPMNNRIQTPSEIAGASCSFNFDSVALSLLKSADKSFKSQIEIVNDFLLVGEEYYDSCDDNSSSSGYSRYRETPRYVKRKDQRKRR